MTRKFSPILAVAIADISQGESSCRGAVARGEVTMESGYEAS